MSEILSNQLTIGQIPFPNGNYAHKVTAKLNAKDEDIIKALQLKPHKALILIIGGAKLSDEAQEALSELFNFIAKVAKNFEALIMDGGTHTGVMAAIGKSIATYGYQSQLLGVAPSKKVSYPGSPTNASSPEIWPLDHNHSHFVLVESDKWGDETETLYRLAKELSGDSRVVTILASGGAISKKEALRSARFGWPIIVIEGSGQFADEVAQKEQIPGKDSIIESIGENSEIYRFPISGSPIDLEALISGLIKEETTIKFAWERFAIYDKNAKTHRRNFLILLYAVLSMNIIGIILVLIQTRLKIENVPSSLWIEPRLRIFIPIFFIISIVLLVGVKRFNLGRKWISLRSSAEMIKSHIFRYRVRTGIYRKTTGNQDKETTPEAKLARNINVIIERLNPSVDLSALRPYCGPIPPKMYAAETTDNGINRLTAEDYVKIRLGDQKNYFERKTTRLERSRNRLYFAIGISGLVGIILAACGFELWTPLITTFLTSLIIYLEYDQIENRLRIYNHSLDGLSKTYARWTALSFSEKKKQENIDEMVDVTESILIESILRESYLNINDKELEEKDRSGEKERKSLNISSLDLLQRPNNNLQVQPQPMKPDFDVFLAHNSKDKPQVEAISEKLKQYGLKPWFDKEQIPPGRWFQDVIQQAIPNIKSAAILIGPDGLGKWQSAELRAFISQCVDENGILVIPVLLPGVRDIPENLSFLKGLNWVAFKNLDDQEAINKLVWGITGKHPKSSE